MFPPGLCCPVTGRATTLLTSWPRRQWSAFGSRGPLPSIDGTGRCAAIEVLVDTPFVSDCILYPDRTQLIQSAIAAGTSQHGMQTFDQAIHELYQDGRVSHDTVLRWASNRDEFTMRPQGVTSTADGARDEMADARPGNTGEPPVITRFGE